MKGEEGERKEKSCQTADKSAFEMSAQQRIPYASACVTCEHLCACACACVRLRSVCACHECVCVCLCECECVCGCECVRDTWVSG